MEKGSQEKLPENPFLQIQSPPRIWGRELALQQIVSGLFSSRRCSPIIGEAYSGKSTLLDYFAHPQGTLLHSPALAKRFPAMPIFVRLNANKYYVDEKASDENIWEKSWDFWHDLFIQLQEAIGDSPRGERSPETHIRPTSVNQDTCNIISDTIENTLLPTYKNPIVLILDDLDGFVNLPIENSEWLYAILQATKNLYCIVSARYEIAFIVHPHTGVSSPFALHFTDHNFIGLLDSNEAAREMITWDGALKDFWKKTDVSFIEKLAGRHPAFLKRVCAVLYEWRQQNPDARLDDTTMMLLEDDLQRKTYRMCHRLWTGLADWNEYIPTLAKKGHHYQEVLHAIASGGSTDGEKEIPLLKNYGLIEESDHGLRVFGKLMQNFVKNQEIEEKVDKEILREFQHPLTPTAADLTFAESELYDFLKDQEGKICSKEEIKKAIWKGKKPLPSDSALQKLVERIREKIEEDPKRPKFLIAAKGRGYMLKTQN